MTTNLKYITATFAAAGTVSTEFDLRNYRLVGLATAADFVTANLTFKQSLVQGGTKLNVVSSDQAAVTLTAVVASEIIWLNDTATEAAGYCTLTSSAAQTTGTTVTLIVKQDV